MKHYPLKILIAILVILSAISINSVYAYDTSIAPSDENIIITNNAGKSDTVYVSELLPGDVVKVYNAATNGTMLGTATVYSSKSDTTISVTQLGSSSGNVYVSVKSTGMLESSRVKVDFDAEQRSTAPSADDIDITNNAGKYDNISISNLNPKDIVNVYTLASKGKLLGSGTVPSGKYEITLSISQIGTGGGSIYVSIKSDGMLESTRTKASFSAETRSTAPDEDDIVVNNTAGKVETLTAANLTSGDIVKAYNSSSGGKLLGKGAVSAYKTEVTFSLSQLTTTAGIAYVSVTSDGKLESSRTPVNYTAKPKSDPPDSDAISIVNNALSDTVNVSGLSTGDLVKVYSYTKSGIVLGTGTVQASKTDVTVTIKQLGTTAGYVYVSVTSPGMLESSKVLAAYSSELKTDAPSSDDITITNNSGKADTIKVTDLSEGNIVKVYNSAKSGKLLVSGTVPASGSELTLSINQLGTATGFVYISVTESGKQESDKTSVAYSAELKSSTPNAGNVVITNNSGTADTVKITGLTEADIVKVYDAAKGGNLLGSGTVAASNTEATVSISQLGKTSGTVYISVTSVNEQESARINVDYSSESKSSLINANNVTVNNNVVASDTIKVTGLSSGYIVKVYDSLTGGTLLGSATVGADSTQATVTVKQLGTSAGSIYISLIIPSKQEGDRTQITYLSEAQTNAPIANNITIVNNAGKAGTVRATGLTGGDTIYVYDASIAGNLLGTATVGTYDTEATVSVTQLGSTSGSVYVSVMNTGKTESSRTKVDFSAKPISSTILAKNVTIVNNSGVQDTITVSNLDSGDIIKAYDSETNGTLLGTATVSSGSMQATITVTQLGSGSGSVYLTITNSGKLESARAKIDYSSESSTDTPVLGNILIYNNSGASDTITVTGLLANDVIKVYTASTGGSLLGTATVPSGGSEATVSIKQLGSASGTVYISITSSGKTESSRMAAVYSSESAAPSYNNIAIVNNALISDSITVKGLAENDVVKVYDASQGGNLLGSATVATGKSEATVYVSQLTSGAGNVYISVTSFGKSESSRTKADYISEQTTNPLYIGNVTILNNTGASDTITITNLNSSDLINVYASESSDTLLGTATVSNSGSSVTISISQLGTESGSVYISVTSLGKYESTRIKVNYTAEVK